jgi:hypothetical protein
LFGCALQWRNGGYWLVWLCFAVVKWLVLACLAVLCSGEMVGIGLFGCALQWRNGGRWHPFGNRIRKMAQKFVSLRRLRAKICTFCVTEVGLVKEGEILTGIGECHASSSASEKW